MALKYESLTRGKTRLRLGPVDGAIVTAGPRGFSLRAAVRALNLKGKLGQNPLQLAAADIRFEAPEGGFAANGLKVLLGTQDAPTVLELARLTGSFATPLSGTLEGGAGRLGNVPLLMSDADRKRVVSGKGGSVRVDLGGRVMMKKITKNSKQRMTI